MFSSVRHIHFVGIGGIGMSAIAEILLSQGFKVSGSDAQQSDNTEYLRELGATIYIGHKAENIKDAEVVVYSSAVRVHENVETLAALETKVPIIRRAEMLAEVTRLNYCLAVAGTHGKTTTTSMSGMVFVQGGLDPTVIVGGRLRGLNGSNARLGHGQWTVVEADEYDRSFLQLLPTIAIITNIEAEHLDIYKDLDDIKATFLQFIQRVPFYGAVIACIDDPVVRELIPQLNKRVLSYGIDESAELRAVDITYSGRSSRSRILYHGQDLGFMTLNIPGLHNIRNALAAVGSALMLNIPFSSIATAMAEFNGVLRRFEILGENNGVMVVEDYAHHHTEVMATLASARQGWGRRIVAVFQPHTYTRTRDFLKEMGTAFKDADVVIVADIYASREKPIEGVHSMQLVKELQANGHPNVMYLASKEEIISELKNVLQANDMLISLGAGDIYKVARAVVADDFRLKAR